MACLISVQAKTKMMMTTRTTLRTLLLRPLLPRRQSKRQCLPFKPQCSISTTDCLDHNFTLYNVINHKCIIAFNTSSSHVSYQAQTCTATHCSFARLKPAAPAHIVLLHENPNYK